MGSNTLRKRCPQCRKIRKYTVPANHRMPSEREWEKVNGVWVCCWCIARAKPGGEAELKVRIDDYKRWKKQHKKKRKLEEWELKELYRRWLSSQVRNPTGGSSPS